MSAFEADRQSPEIAGLVNVKIPSVSVPLYRKLYVQVLVAVALGAALGYAAPDFSVYLKPLGDAFIKAIKVVVAPIIFTTIALGIAKMRDIRHVANVGVKALIYFEVASTLALVIGMIVGNGCTKCGAFFRSRLRSRVDCATRPNSPVSRYLRPP